MPGLAGCGKGTILLSSIAAGVPPMCYCKPAATLMPRSSMKSFAIHTSCTAAIGSSICFISFGYGSTATMYINKSLKNTACIGYFREPAGTSMAGKAILAACQAFESADTPCCMPAECLPAPALDLWCCALAEGLLLTEGRPFMWPSSGKPPLTEDGEYPLLFWLSCTAAWGPEFLLGSWPLRAARSAHWLARLSWRHVACAAPAESLPGCWCVPGVPRTCDASCQERWGGGCGLLRALTYLRKHLTVALVHDGDDAGKALCWLHLSEVRCKSANVNTT